MVLNSQGMPKDTQQLEKKIATLFSDLSHSHVRGARRAKYGAAASYQSADSARSTWCLVGSPFS